MSNCAHSHRDDSGRQAPHEAHRHIVGKRETGGALQRRVQAAHGHRQHAWGRRGGCLCDVARNSIGTSCSAQACAFICTKPAMRQNCAGLKHSRHSPSTIPSSSMSTSCSSRQAAQEPLLKAAGVNGGLNDDCFMCKIYSVVLAVNPVKGHTQTAEAGSRHCNTNTVTHRKTWARTSQPLQRMQ